MSRFLWYVVLNDQLRTVGCRDFVPADEVHVVCKIVIVVICYKAQAEPGCLKNHRRLWGITVILGSAGTWGSIFSDLFQPMCI
jgi:hypothetical protein